MRPERSGWAGRRCNIRRAWTYFWSKIWFLQELLIFFVGARVFWKRPNDDSARLFFVLCIVTVGAFMGGYHWTEIVFQPALIYLFALFAVFVPVVNLHFYLVFPASQSRSWSGIAGGCWDAVRGLDGLSRPALGRACGWRAAVARRYDPRTPMAFGVVRGLSLGLCRAGRGDLPRVRRLPDLQLPARPDAGRAEPGAVDPAAPR